MRGFFGEPIKNTTLISYSYSLTSIKISPCHFFLCLNERLLYLTTICNSLKSIKGSLCYSFLYLKLRKNPPEAYQNFTTPINWKSLIKASKNFKVSDVIEDEEHMED